jgi:YgiT-type zinc finger domain-containing protein
MKCLICRQAEMVNGFTSVTLERDEIKLTMKNVPAILCPNCGDACVEEEVVVRLLDTAERAVEAGARNGVLGDLEFIRTVESDS